MSGLQDATRRKGSFLATVKAIGWAFFGVRGGNGHERDLTHLNPLHVIIVGLLLAAAFVAGLVVLVSWVVG